MAKATAAVSDTASLSYSIGRNVMLSRDGDIITITIDLEADAPLSTSGKNESIATTGAAADVGSLGDGRPVKLNISCYVPFPAHRAVEAAAVVAAVKAAKAAAKEAAKLA